MTIAAETTAADLDTAFGAAQKQIAGLPETETLDWVVGVRPPPEAVTAEVAARLRALRDELGAEAGDVPLLAVHRSFTAQQRIWLEKYHFTVTRPFGDITAQVRQQFTGLVAPEGKWDPAVPYHRYCWQQLTSAQRQVEILRTASAPGISRHHWGTEADLGSLEPRDWAEGRLTGVHDWLRDNAARHGFGATTDRPWHWSYAPVSRALRQWVTEHDALVERRLRSLWWGSEFSYVEEHWRSLLLDPQ